MERYTGSYYTHSIIGDRVCDVTSPNPGDAGGSAYPGSLSSLGH